MAEHIDNRRASHYSANSLSLTGAVAMSTGVMIGAGIFALTGQVAELAGSRFSLAFLAAAVVTASSAYTYVKLSNAYPSAGGIAMSLEKASAIVISIAICVLVYLLVSLAVGGSLSIGEIVAARDYALAEAARPVFGDLGLLFTVMFAIVATASGVVASVFAVSRVLAMVTEMKLVPHSHLGMPGTIQKHALVYTIVIAMVLTAFFDLGRIAALGAIFYMVMDIAVHWDVFRYLRKEIAASGIILVAAMAFDLLVLVALLIIKAQSDALVIFAAIIGIALVFVGERLFLGKVHSA